MSVRKWAKENESVIVVFGSLLGIGAIGLAIIKFFFAPPVLELTVRTSDLRLPETLYQKFGRALSVDSARLSDSSGAVMRQVRWFLRDTKTFTEIRLTNTSRNSLSNVDLRFRYVRDLAGWALEGDNLDNDEKERLFQAVRYDPGESMLTLHGITRLPPKSTVTLFVWGNVEGSALLGSDQLTVTYDGGAGELRAERSIDGLDAFVYDNSGLLVILLLLLNLGLWGAYLDWKEKQIAKKTAPQSVADPTSPI